ncbi:MAG: hypothetical protein JXB88_09365, partial [Spirochaetales bacterium]|nr:hypothetical protein [Spirochaetales bacterium]
EGSDGISFLPELIGKKQATHEYLYWEFPESGGQQALRIGDFKIMRKNMNNGNLEFEIYDLENDPAETKNIAEKHPELINRAEDIITREHLASTNPRWQIGHYDKQ